MNKKKSLEERIAEARKDIEDKEDKYMGVPLEESDEDKKGKRAASEFLGAVISGSIIGILCDRTFQTEPWATLFFVTMGFVAGVYRANHLTNKK